MQARARMGFAPLRWSIQPDEERRRLLRLIYCMPIRQPGCLGIAAQTRWLCVAALRQVCPCRGRKEAICAGYASLYEPIGLREMRDFFGRGTGGGQRIIR